MHVFQVPSSSHFQVIWRLLHAIIKVAHSLKLLMAVPSRLAQLTSSSKRSVMRYPIRSRLAVIQQQVEGLLNVWPLITITVGKEGA
jgi:hypothetical protein